MTVPAKPAGKESPKDAPALASAYYSGKDVMSAQMMQACVDFNLEWTKLSGELAAAEGDRETAVNNFMATSDDSVSAKLRNQIEKLSSELKAHAEKTVKSVVLTPEETAKLKAELESVKTQIRDSQDAVMSIAKAFKVDVEGVAEALKKIGDPTRTGRGRAKGEAGSQLPRPRVYLEVSGGNLVEAHSVDSFSNLGKLTGVDVELLQKEYAKAANVSHDDISKVGKVTVFKYDTGAKDIGVFEIKVTPKSLVKTAPVVAGSNADPELSQDEAEQDEAEDAQTVADAQSATGIVESDETQPATV